MEGTVGASRDGSRCHSSKKHLDKSVFFGLENYSTLQANSATLQRNSAPGCVFYLFERVYLQLKEDTCYHCVWALSHLLTDVFEPSLVLEITTYNQMNIPNGFLMSF